MFEQLRKYFRRKKNPVDLLSALAPKGTELTTLVHVGAHLAQERHNYEKLGYKNVLWVEGSPAVFDRLEGVLSAHDGPAHHEAVCALLTDKDNEPVALKTFANDGMSSSIFSATDESLERWPAVVETGEVESTLSLTLDSLLQQKERFSSCQALIVDVQGAELLVLKGAEQTLATCNAVIAEVSTIPYYKGGVMFDELSAFLKERGFEPMSVPRRHGDMLFLRDSELAGKFSANQPTQMKAA